MRGTKTTTTRLTCLLTLAAASCTAAALPEYFPLQTGNSWVYRVTQGRTNRAPAAINVGETVSADGRTYYRVQYFERELLLRQADTGSLMVWNADTKQESTFLPFGAADKQPVPVAIDNCSTAARVENRSATVTTDIGEFNNALELRYTGNCADAGITMQYFLPWVGMVSAEMQSIAGPVRYELTYSRTGITNIDTRTNAFTLATDAPVYQAGQTVEGTARFTLRTSERITLTFPSGQSTDLRITNSRGETVYVWSADKLFTAVFRQEPVGPGEKSWAISFPVGQLPPGRYLAEGWLTTQPRQYSATVAFEVK
jgi:hypothetical protein